METRTADKHCGNCKYFRRETDISGRKHYVCYVYSFSRKQKDKGCRNWKIKEHDTNRPR